MGKKVHNPKLLKSKGGNGQTMLSVFNRFANKVTDSHRKKIEKVGDTKQRLMDNKKQNRMVKVSKRTSKFALMEDDQPMHGLTHKGTNINDLKHFNDMNFDSDIEDQEFLKAHENLNFTGFDQEQPKQDPDRPKTKADIYKEIIEKSKMHRHLRQEVYEENFQKAVELDEKFPELASKLKFRTRDTNVRDKMNNADPEYQKLMNELKQDERVVSNKVLEKNEKYTDKMRKKKNEQLNAIMKDNSDSEDIRAWAKGANEQSQAEDDEDDLDDVQLSSEEDDDQEEGQSEDNQQQDQDEAEQNQEEQQESQPSQEPVLTSKPKTKSNNTNAAQMGKQRTKTKK